MPEMRSLIAAVVWVFLLPQVAPAAPKSEPVKQDSLNAIKTDLRALASRFSRISSPSQKQVTEVRLELMNLSGRLHRLPDWRSPAAQEVDALLREFRMLLPTPGSDPSQASKVAEPSVRKVTEPSVRKITEPSKSLPAPNPEALQDISTPQLAEGGHTAQGAAWLKGQIDRFGARYRKIKGQDTTEARGADSTVDFSRSNLKRSIEFSLEVARDQIATNSYDANTIHIVQGGGVSLLNYSPQKNLQWAYDVATLGIRFESHVGGKAEVWRAWQKKIRTFAAQNGLTLEDRVH